MMLLDAKDIKESHYDYEDDDLQRDSGMSLGMIFVLLISLLVVGGTCFGVGYMVGHNNMIPDLNSKPAQAATAQSATTQALPKMVEAAAAPVAAVTDMQPASSTPAQVASTPAPAPEKPVQKTEAKAETQTATKAAPQAQAKAAPSAKPAANHKHPAERTAVVTHHTDIARRPDPFTHLVSNPNYGAETSFPSHQPMVQVAILYRDEDATVLLDALSKHGYTASANRGSDKRIHVRLGPFASRDDASAMRDKLQSDGYNAVIQ
jgi:cytoskeletal protein RodZ